MFRATWLSAAADDAIAECYALEIYWGRSEWPNSRGSIALSQEEESSPHNGRWQNKVPIYFWRGRDEIT